VVTQELNLGPEKFELGGLYLEPNLSQTVKGLLNPLQEFLGSAA